LSDFAEIRYVGELWVRVGWESLNSQAGALGASYN